MPRRKKEDAEAQVQVEEFTNGDVEAQDTAEAEPEAPRVPAVGETVLYHYPQGGVRPAIVVGVHDANTVDLAVLTAGAADRSAVPERVVMVNVNTGADMHAVPPVVFRPAVRRGEGPGEWGFLGRR